MIVTKESARAFKAMVLASKRVVIVGHLNPDGDCVGSVTGMKSWIRSLCSAECSVVLPNAGPDYLNFLDPDGQIVYFFDSKEKGEELISAADLIIAMDFNTLSRTEWMKEYIASSTARKVLIDHHPSPEPFADLTISTTEISSASELTWWLLKETGEEIPMESCISLYTGMMTDTNNFSNSVFASTFLMASQIEERKVDREKIQMNVLNSFSESRMRLMGKMLLEKMRIFPHLKAAVMVMDKKTQEEFNYKEGDSEGFVNLALKIADVEVSGFFTETENYIKVSLRSKGAVSVNALSRRFFNGGGHERAAGGRIYIPVHQVEEYFENSLESFLKEINGTPFDTK